VLFTIAILLVGCFVVCAALLLLAFITDRSRKPGILLARRGAASRRRAQWLGRP
jgi:hypothetical protein